MNFSFPVAADFAFLAAAACFYSFRKILLNFNYFSFFYALHTIVHDFGLNRCEVEGGLKRVDRMSAAIISFVRFAAFHIFLCTVFPCVFLLASAKTVFSTWIEESFPRLSAPTHRQSVSSRAFNMQRASQIM